MNEIGTGYFANEKRWTKVHLVYTNTNIPICNSRIKSDMHYKFCASGIFLSYVRCEHCKRIITRKPTQELLNGLRKKEISHG